MKHLILPISLALSLSCGAAFAQQTPDAQQPQDQAPAAQGYHHHHAPNPQKQAEYISRQLNLTADQTAKIEPILATRDQQMQDLHQNAQLSEQDRHQQMHAINEQAQQGMATFLSPDQMAQLKAMRHGHRHHNENGDNTQSPSM